MKTKTSQTKSYNSDGYFVGGGYVYYYDGTFDGLMCCIYESYTRREPVMEISSEYQPSLHLTREIETCSENANRVYASLSKKMGKQGKDLVVVAFLSCVDGKEKSIYDFVVLGYKYGVDTCRMLGDAVVSKIYKINRYVRMEAHKMLGFVRFSQYTLGDECETGLELSKKLPTVLVSVIETKNNVLPLIARHFCNRFPDESFVIYDKVNKQALVYSDYGIEITPMEDFVLEHAGSEELKYRKLWKNYYDTVAIKERYNPNCRRNFMPKHYWKHLTEMGEGVEIDNL